MTFRTYFALACLLSSPWIGCSSPAGGGGGGFVQQSSAGPDTPCNPTTHGSGCRIGVQQVMSCDAASSKWVAGPVCPTGAYCLEQVQPGATVFTATCMQSATTTTDATNATDGGAQTSDSGAVSDGEQLGADTTGAQDTGAQDTGAQDTGAQDTGAQDTGAQDTGAQDTGVADTADTDTGSGDTTTSGDVLPSDPIVEPSIAQPSVGSTVLAPQVTCPSDGTQVTSEKNGFKVVYHVKKTAAGDVLHGSYEAADSKGTLRTKSCYINGKKAGTYTGWWADGTKRVSIHYAKMGSAQGPYEMWDEKGNTVAKGVLKDDKFYGVYTRWYDGGTQLDRKVYFNPPGQLRGVQKFWHENGQESARSFYDNQGKQTGTSRSWDDTGKLIFQGNYVNGYQHGVHTWWNAAGVVLGQVKFIQGTGVLLLKHPNGKISDSGKLVSGKREGLWESFVDDGTKTFEGTYTANAGPVKYWFASGKKGIVSAHDNELQFHGAYAEWDASGVQTWGGKMAHGLRVGPWTYAPQAGQVVDLCYVDGELVLYDMCPTSLVTE